MSSTLRIAQRGSRFGLSVCVAFLLYGCGAAVPPRAIPTPDTSIMQPAVRELLDECRSKVVENPESTEDWGRYGMALDAHSMLAEAETCYRQARDLEPEEFRWSYLLGKVLELQGDASQEALSMWRHAASLNPNFAPVFYRLGELEADIGQLDEAIEHLGRSLELEPDLAIAHRSLGQALLQRGELQRGIEHLLRAESISPGDEAVGSSLASALARAGRTEEAESYARKTRTPGAKLHLTDPIEFEVVSLGRSSELCFDRGRERLKRGEIQAGIEDLQIVASVRPDDAQVHDLLGRAYYDLHDLPSALEHLQRATDLDANLATAHFALAQTLVQLKRMDGALEHFRSAVGLEPDNGSYVAALALHLTGIGQLNEAASVFERADRLDTLRPAQLQTWANVLLRLREFPRAAGLYERVLEAQPQNADAHFALAQALHGKGDLEGTERHLRAAVEVDPNHRAAALLRELGFDR